MQLHIGPSDSAMTAAVETQILHRQPLSQRLPPALRKMLSAQLRQLVPSGTEKMCFPGQDFSIAGQARANRSNGSTRQTWNR